MSAELNKGKGSQPPYDGLERLGGLAPIVGVPVANPEGEMHPDIDQPWPDVLFEDGENPIQEDWPVMTVDPGELEPDRAVRRVDRSAFNSPPVATEPLTPDQITARKLAIKERIKNLVAPPGSDLATQDKATVTIARASIRARRAEMKKAGFC